MSNSKQELKIFMENIPVAIGSMYQRYKAGDVDLNDFRIFRNTLLQAALLAYVRYINC